MMKNSGIGRGKCDNRRRKGGEAGLGGGQRPLKVVVRIKVLGSTWL